MYVHIVDKKKDGIVVRGAKMHQTGATNSHEILVMPTLALKGGEKDYAVCFALPLNAPGITLFFGRQVNDTRRLEGGKIDLGNYDYGIVGGECLITFEDVFVPEERVFMAGEVESSRDLVTRFATAHRQNYGGCRVGIADVMIGAIALLAEIQGIDKFSHVREKLVDLVYLAERLYACSLSCSAEGKPTPSGAYFADTMLANVTKLTASQVFYDLSRGLHEIAGGFVATTPSEQDFKNPEEAKLLNKYFECKAGVPAEYRIRLGRYIENITSSTPFLEFMHGAGSPQTQRAMLFREADFEAKKRLAKKVVGIP
jgi:4-hydroxybutyryl-CoA dehydratase/vinylacetyl-CoA-Delta-isomerase